MPIGLLTLLLILSACGSESRQFKIDARFTQINQGEFYLYSPDEIIEGIDTVRLQGGRFVYSLNTNRPGILVIIFPNYSEQPVFVEPGKDVKIKGDVTHLREMQVNGTTDNKLMNRLRQQLATASPPEQVAFARQFIEDYPQSIVGTYLVGRYFLQGDSANYQEAHRLIALMHEHQPDNGYLVRLAKQTIHIAATTIGQPLPQLTLPTLDGDSVSTEALAGKPLAIICPLASWNQESIVRLRKLNTQARRQKADVAVVGLSLDGSKSDCRKIVDRDTLDAVTIVCDEKLFDSPAVQQLAVYSVYDNIVVHDGRIEARALSTDKLLHRMTSLSH